MPIDYTIRIPVNVSGQEALSQIDTILGRIGTQTKATAGELRLLESVLKADAAAGLSLSASLKEVTQSATAFSPAIRQSASELLRQAAAAETSVVAHTRLDAILSKIGGRFAGMASGIPGGGFIGGQAGGALGLSGAGAIGLGAVGVGAFAGFEYVNHVEELAKWAQAQKNLAAETGITVGQMQQLSRVSEITGVNLTAATKATANLSEELLKGGARAKEIGSALGQLGLGSGVAFENPSQAINTVVGALAKIPDAADRARVAVQLLGESGRGLAAVSTEWGSATGKTKIIDDETIKRLSDAQENLKALGNAWDVLLGKASKPLTFIINTIAGGGTMSPGDPFATPNDVRKNYTNSSPIDVTHGGVIPFGSVIGPPRLASDAQISGNIAQGKADRLKQFTGFASAYGTPEDTYSAATSGISTKQEALKQQFVNGSLSEAEARSQYASLESQKAAAKETERRANQLREQRDRFQSLIRKPVESGAEALRLLGQLPKEFPDLTGTSDYLGFQQFLLLGNGGGLAAATAEAREGTERFAARTDAESRGVNRGYDREYALSQRLGGENDRAVTESAGLVGRGITGQRGLDEARARQGLAFTSGTSRYGFTSSQLRRLDYSQAAGAIQAELAPQRTALLSTAYADQYAAGQLPEGSDSRLKLEQEARSALLELDVKELDAKTKGIEAVNRFNESIDKAAEAMRSQFSNGFESILMGAQHGAQRGQAGKGALDALRGFGESIESTILRNVGAKIFDTGGGSATRKLGAFLPDWLTQGTILGKQDEPIKANTDATSINTKAIEANTAAQRGGGGGSVVLSSSGGLNYTPTNYTPIPSSSSSSTGATGTANDVAQLASVAAGLSTVTTGSASQDLKAVASTLSKLDSVMKGTKYAGNVGKILSGTLSTGQEVGAIAGTVGLGIGAYEGISTAAKGGARNIAGGIGGTLAAIAPFTGPAAPFVEAAAAVAGLTAAFVPDPKTQRANQIQKAIFTQQYLAPQAQNITESGGGGYSDFDTNGGVRTSSFSPYPIISQSYEDVPRRVVVPGHTLSPFGGFQNVTGAKTPAGGVQYNLNIQSFDSRDVISHGPAIADALHHHLQSNFHPLINTLGSQLGVR